MSRRPSRTSLGRLVLLSTGACILTAAAASPLLAQEIITVGPNVQVSAGHAAATHYEVLAAVDPNEPAHMIVGSFLYPPGGGTASTVVYASRDGGQSWAPTLGGEALRHTSDPAPAYGPDGTAYYTASSLGPSGTPRSGRRMLLYRSPDGGQRWEGPFPFTYSDRQYITVDHTGGEHHGRLYVNGNNRVPYGISDFVVFTSSDGGRSFEGPGKRDGFGSFGASVMGNAVVASDGSLTGVFIDGDLVQAIRSTDGGASLEPAVTIDDGFVRPGNRKGARNHVVALPYLAIDGGDGPFADRLYVVWGDRRTGQSRIFFSRSDDGGASWSAARPIDDAPDHAPGPFMPSVAVNRDGVLGVTWYDRRNHPDSLGWDVRFAASTDGGETFLPSVGISEQGTTFHDAMPWTGLQISVSPVEGEEGGGIRVGVMLNSFTFQGGDTAGLVADAAGVFHPVWVDNRTGVSQVWTAPVRVGAGAAADRGSAVAQGGSDVTDRVTLELVRTFHERSTETLTAVVRLKNTSTGTLRGPFAVEVTELASELGDIAVARGFERAPEWSFSEVSLEPGAVSEPRTWRFTLSDVAPYRSGDRYSRRLLRMTVRITAPADGDAPK